MNVLIFEYKNIGIEDVCEALRNLGHSYKCITHAAISDSFNKEFDELFDKERPFQVLCKLQKLI